jgi:hypothetical protein
VGVLTTSLSFSFGFNYFMSSRKEGEWKIALILPTAATIQSGQTHCLYH